MISGLLVFGVVLGSGQSRVNVETLLEEIRERHVKNGNDLDAWFFKAQVLTHAISTAGADMVVVFNQGRYEAPATFSVLQPFPSTYGEQQRDWIQQAVVAYARCTQFNSKNGRYALGYAYLMENLARNFTAITGTGGIGPFREESDVWAKVGSEYRRAFNVRKDLDPVEPIAGVADSQPSREAARALIRLHAAGKVRSFSAEIDRWQRQLIKLGG